MWTKKQRRGRGRQKKFHPWKSPEELATHPENIAAVKIADDVVAL